MSNNRNELQEFKMKKAKYYIISFAALLILWELLAVSGAFPESLFPSPVQVAEALAARISSGALLLDGITLTR